MFTYVIDSAGGDKKYVIHVKFFSISNFRENVLERVGKRRRR